MHLSIFSLIVLIGFVSLSVTGTSLVFGDSIGCPSCVQISYDDIELYKELFPIIAWTDSQVFNHDSIVKVSGHLRPENNVAPVLVVVTNPIGNVVTIDQIAADSNGDFSLNLNTQSPLWSKDGDYIVKVQSGSDNRVFKTKFTLISYDVGDVSNCTINDVPVTADNGGVYCIPFESSKGTTINVEGTLKLSSKTLSLHIRGNNIDSVILDVPRYLLDAKNPTGTDADFVVVSDGKLVEFNELESDADSRQIKLDYYPTRNGNFDIVGTHVVPEFGSFVMLILIGSIFSVLIIGRSFSNKFVKF